jgi:hypothetical protein
MVNLDDPRIIRLTQAGYELASHQYLKKGRASYTIIALDRGSGLQLRGWSRQSSRHALDDLFRRSKRILGEHNP